MRILRNLAILSAAILIPATSMAIVPDPSQSSTPACIRVVPDGSFPVAVAVVGTDGAALGGDEVRLIFSAGCTALIQCSGGTPIVFSGISSAGGLITFNPDMGGCCSASGAAEIEADPGAVTLASYGSVGSPDADGSGKADIVDFTLFQGAFLSVNACFDYQDCDDTVLLQDFTVFQSKFLVEC